MSTKGRMPVLRTLRARITAAATIIVAIVMMLASIGFSAVLSSEVRDATTRAAETRAAELATRIDDSGTAGIADLDDDIVQVVDESGRVVAASEDAEEGTLPADRDGEVVTYDGDPVLIVVDEADDDARVVLAVPVDGDEATLATAGWLLAASTLLVVLVVAAVTWWVVGRALRPVGRIRREVDDITADRLDRRVPEPSSGDEIAALAVTMTACSTDSTRPRRRSGGSCRTPRTSCAPRSRPCASMPSSPAPIPRRRPSTTSPRW
ncbi:HAMP domain-containing protein [Microbacterium sp. SORGH_AS 505]|uniref:HAMP domain-containing protein n=1 Tax=Microbacterium sp. SORGH_AS_0505 TaxID=3041770 RepID=UPI0027862A3C|nr:HAMP domain-containing protein [Microbacterium sp. SORGH_AS_0505]MDQ1125885.1 HAMP domain-containing protein [Microbacterium sp. SORGH_AS_0505]